MSRSWRVKFRVVKTIGIDLATESANTGFALIEWGIETAQVVRLDAGKQKDSYLAGWIQAVDKVAIDCPFGWPLPFIDYITAHRDGLNDRVNDLAGSSRHHLQYRSTDMYVRETIGVTPLSVSADRIGSGAMRCAKILAEASDFNLIDRTGRTGKVVEVYPAAALKVWGLPHKGYKGIRPEHAHNLEALATLFLAAVPWLEIEDQDRDLAHSSNDAFDALVCAVLARYSLAGACQEVPADADHVAPLEGWIALPAKPLGWV